MSTWACMRAGRAVDRDPEHGHAGALSLEFRNQPPARWATGAQKRPQFGAGRAAGGLFVVAGEEARGVRSRYMRFTASAASGRRASQGVTERQQSQQDGFARPAKDRLSLRFERSKALVLCGGSHALGHEESGAVDDQLLAIQARFDPPLRDDPNRSHFWPVDVAR